MDYSFETNTGTITIGQKTILNTVKKIAKSLSLYEIADVKIGESIKGLFAFYIYLKNNNSSINYFNYINKLQEKLEKSISVSLNLTNFFSIIILA